MCIIKNNLTFESDHLSIVKVFTSTTVLYVGKMYGLMPTYYSDIEQE